MLICLAKWHSMTSAGRMPRAPREINKPRIERLQPAFCRSPRPSHIEASRSKLLACIKTSIVSNFVFSWSFFRAFFRERVFCVPESSLCLWALRARAHSGKQGPLSTDHASSNCCHSTGRFTDNIRSSIWQLRLSLLRVHLEVGVPPPPAYLARTDNL
jgi:hypothetical protein